MRSKTALQITAEMVQGWIPPRRRDSHKRMNGTVCVIGGSWLYHGAPFLCASGALRSGIDLVYVAVPKSIAPSVRSLSPDFIVVPLPDSKLTRGNLSKLMTWVKGVNVFAVGPGLGAQKPENVAHWLGELKGEGKGLVVDADALLPGALPALKDSGAVVTPHSGEFERLFGTDLPDDADERQEVVKTSAQKSGLVVLLKGPVDVISDGKRISLNTTHSPAMTVGGTGDILTGITAGLMSKGVGPFEAASAAAYINGAAGEDAFGELGLHITASDVVARIPKVMKRFDAVE